MRLNLKGLKPSVIGMAFLSVLMLNTFNSAPVFAQSAADFKRAKERAELEPQVNDIVREALKYFRVAAVNIQSLRDTSRARGVLPMLAIGYRFENNALSVFQNQTGTATFSGAQNSGTNVHSFTVGAVWDLRELMMNPAEIQAYGLIGVQRDVMLEVARTYYLRRQMMLRLLLRPSDDPLQNLSNQIRVDELTAILDVLTDGWFSRESNRMLREYREKQERMGSVGGGVFERPENISTQETRVAPEPAPVPVRPAPVVEPPQPVKPVTPMPSSGPATPSPSPETKTPPPPITTLSPSTPGQPGQPGGFGADAGVGKKPKKPTGF